MAAKYKAAEKCKTLSNIHRYCSSGPLGRGSCVIEECTVMRFYKRVPEELYLLKKYLGYMKNKDTK